MVERMVGLKADPSGKRWADHWAGQKVDQRVY